MAGMQAGPEPVPATGAQKALAGVVDMAFGAALVGASWWWRNRRAGAAGRQEMAGGVRKLALLAPLKTIFDEQLGSPGAWVAGVRTVDKRTGRRVALWRTVLIVSARVGMRAAAERFTKPTPPLSEADKAEIARETQAIQERFADDEDARNAALMAHYREYHKPVEVNLVGPMAIALGSSVLNSRLRRHLAPTMLVGRPREAPPADHSP